MDTHSELNKILKQEGVEKLESVPTKTDDGVPTDRTRDKGTVGGKAVEKTETNGEGDASQRRIEIRRQPKPAPKLENIIDCMHYKVTYTFKLHICLHDLCVVWGCSNGAK